MASVAIMSTMTLHVKLHSVNGGKSGVAFRTGQSSGVLPGEGSTMSVLKTLSQLQRENDEHTHLY